MIDLATRMTEPSEDERAHLNDCEKCRHLILALSLRIEPDSNLEGAA